MIKSTFDKKEYNKYYYLQNKEAQKKRSAEWAEKNKARKREIARDSYHRRKNKKKTTN